jgi:hypothetical protein
MQQACILVNISKAIDSKFILLEVVLLIFRAILTNRLPRMNSKQFIFQQYSLSIIVQQVVL